MKVKNWEVGSTWYINPASAALYDNIDKGSATLPGDITYLSTCRSAISECIKNIGNIHTALVPAFTCHSVIEPFARVGIDVKGYPVKADLSIDWSGLLNMVNKYNPQVILIHGYFGFDTTADASKHIPPLLHRGIKIIDDQTQNMFSGFRRIYSHFRVGSIRKWLPVPDGAFLSGIKISGLKQDKELSVAKCKAMIAKGDYIFNGNGKKDNLMLLFPVAEKLLDSRTETYAMAYETYSLLGNINIHALKSIRCSNYNRLAARLARCTQIKVLCPVLKPDDVPFMLPVYVENGRLEFQRFMAAHNVFPTIIWKCPEVLKGNIDQTASYIYDNILCFHIDQRYDSEDMDRVADIVDSYFNSTIE